MKRSRTIMDPDEQQHVAPTARYWVLHLGLWPRMALAISLGFLALFATFAILGERALQDSTDRLLKERLVIAQLAASRLDGLVQAAVLQLQHARRFATADLAAETQMLTVLNGWDGTFSSISLLDPTGHVVLSQSPDQALSNTNLAEPPDVVDGFDRRGVTISAPFSDPLSNHALVAVTVPISDQQRLLGFLSGMIDIHERAIMTPLEQAATLSQTGHAVLVDAQGRVMAATFPAAFLSPGEHATFYREAIARGQPIVETVPFELTLPGESVGHAHVTAFAPLRMAPWGVAVGGDVDETFAGVRRLRLGLALLSVVSLICAWAATLVGTRRLVRPVQRLTDAAQRIANGDLHTPLQAPEGGEIGAMASALERMRTLLLANIAELASWSESLEARVGERTTELHQQQALTQQLLHRAITAQEEERARLSRELHDEIGQTLTGVQLSLDRVERVLPATDLPLHERLGRARTLTDQALADLRRMIGALRPGILDQLGLVPALGWVADHTLRPLGLLVTIQAAGLQERLPGDIETILFRIAQEAMSNVARHSGARQMRIRLAREGGQISMSLTDDGRGFDPAAVTAAPDQSRGLGLAGMQERASLAGGLVTVESAPDQGTMVRVVVPLPEATEESLNAGEPTSTVGQR